MRKIAKSATPAILALLLQALPALADQAADATEPPVINGCGLWPHTQCRGADLRHAKLAGRNLAGADFSGAHMPPADLRGEAAGDAVFDRTVDMVTVMATEPDLRDRLRARLEPLVTADTRVVVAHSLGSVLSYMALCNHPDWSVHTFVTLGSPLAAPMALGMLDPAPVDGKGAWPRVERWVNVRAVGDKAAAVPLADTFGPEVEDVLVDNGHRAHAPEPSLNAEPTGAAVPAALG